MNLHNNEAGRKVKIIIFSIARGGKGIFVGNVDLQDQSFDRYNIIWQWLQMEQFLLTPFFTYPISLDKLVLMCTK